MIALRDAAGQALPGLPLPLPTPTPTVLHALDLIGCAVFALSGALAAGRKRMDLIGVIVLGLVTAIGGGTIRDVLLDRHPIFWLADPSYLLVIVATSVLTLVGARRWRREWGTTLLVADALGLALFSVAGAQIAERAGIPPGGAILLGTVTGAAGGAVRDVLSAEIPLVLRHGNLYATAAIAGTGTYFGLAAAGVRHGVATGLGMGVVAAVRFASILWNLKLPVFHLPHTDEHRSLPPRDGGGSAA